MYNDIENNFNLQLALLQNMSTSKALGCTFNGINTVMSNEITFRNGMVNHF